MAEEVVQQLGNYRLTDLLGQGGFAKIYLGEHIYLQTNAAIKVLQAVLSGPDDIDSFLKEAKIIAHLSHTHIVRVLDFGIDKETPFLVMDYAPHGTLRQRHPKKTQLPLPTIVSYVKQVADALQYSHNQRLIHRDIKPENMLIGQRDEILLSDFGIALVTQTSRYHTTQCVVGTVPYMSPEHIQGKARPASDQYSLGIVVYEWLSGDRPFQGSFTELCTQHLFTPVPPLHEKLPTILPEVEQAVLKALAKDPKQRFDSVQAFAETLEQASQSRLKAFMPLPQLIPHITLGASTDSITSSKISAINDAFSSNSQSSSKHQVVMGQIFQEKQTIPPKSKPFKPVEKQPRPISQEKPIVLQSNNRAIPPLEHAKKHNMELLGIGPSNSNMTAYLLDYARKRGAYLTKIAPNNTNPTINTRNIGRREITLMIFCTTSFAILDYCANQLILHHSSLFNRSIGNLPYFPSYSDFLLHNLTFGFALFLAVKFGPWAGCACMLIGNLSGDILTGYLFQAQWHQYINNILGTVISGLSTYNYSSPKRSICSIFIMSFIGIFIINYIMYTIEYIINPLYYINSYSDFISLILTNGSSLIFLIMIFVIDKWVANRIDRITHKVSKTQASRTDVGTEHP